MLNLVNINTKEADSIINNPELRAEDSMQSLVLKIFQKAGKPLHFRDLEYVIVSIGYYEHHNKKIPQDTARPLFAVLRESYGIRKISEGIYGLSEWQNTDSDVVSEEEIELEAQTIQQESSIIWDSVEDFDNDIKNCPICGEKIEIKRHFCTSCGADLSGFCKNCLCEIKERWIFCGDCGTNLRKGD